MTREWYHGGPLARRVATVRSTAVRLSAERGSDRMAPAHSPTVDRPALVGAPRVRHRASPRTGEAIAFALALFKLACSAEEGALTMATNLGFPRMGPNRELKRAVEGFWSGSVDETAMLETAAAIRKDNWLLQRQLGQVTG